MTQLSQAIERHKAAKAACEANPCKDDVDDDPLFNAMTAAHFDLAHTPCASDAEFIEKLRYLLAEETRIWNAFDDPDGPFGSVVAAVDLHFNEEARR
jgi:hypothetical protein